MGKLPLLTHSLILCDMFESHLSKVVGFNRFNQNRIWLKQLRFPDRTTGSEPKLEISALIRLRNLRNIRICMGEKQLILKSQNMKEF